MKVFKFASAIESRGSVETWKAFRISLNNKIFYVMSVDYIEKEEDLVDLDRYISYVTFAMVWNDKFQNAYRKTELSIVVNDAYIMENIDILMNCGVLMSYDEMLKLPTVICYEDNSEMALHLTKEMINSLAEKNLLNLDWEKTLDQENLVKTEMKLEELIQFLLF